MPERSDDLIHQLTSWARAYGVDLSPSHLQRLGIFLDELDVWNRHLNLTGASSRERVLRELILDSLIPLPFLPHQGELLDVGSGAGFPAIPLKICRPQLGFHLLEANSKKVSFLKQVVRLTRLSPVRITQGRMERDGDLLRPAGYNAITARALAKLPRVLAWCAPHLAEDGLLLNFQGSGFREALEDSASALDMFGMALRRTVPYTLPGMASPRHLLIFEKAEPTP